MVEGKFVCKDRDCKVPIDETRKRKVELGGITIE